MNRTDRTIAFQIFLTIAVLVLIAVVIGVLAGRLANDPAEQVAGEISDTDFLAAQTVERIKPVGQVVTTSMVEANPELALGAVKSDTVAVKKTGKEVVDGLCASCHVAGVGNAPRFDNTADWSARYANGMAALMEVGMKGKPGTTMMAKGGDPSLTEDDIWNAIIDMLQRAGVAVTETPRGGEPEAE